MHANAWSLPSPRLRQRMVRGLAVTTAAIILAELLLHLGVSFRYGIALVGLAAAYAAYASSVWGGLPSALAAVLYAAFSHQRANALFTQSVDAALITAVVGIPLLVLAIADIRMRLRRETLIEAHQRLESITAHLDAILVVDPRLRIAFANHTAEAWLGVSAERLVGRSIGDVAHVALAGTAPHTTGADPVQAAVRDGTAARFDHALVRGAEGAARHAEGGVTKIDDPRHGELYVVTFRDITRRVEALCNLERAQAILVAAQQLAHVGSWQDDYEDLSSAWSDELYRIMGTDARALRASPHALASFDHPDEAAHVGTIRREAMETHTPYSVEHRLLLRDGAVRYVRERGEYAYDAAGNAISLTGTVMDITEQRQAEERARHLAHHDALTGLANRELVIDRLTQALAWARQRGEVTAAVIVDLDRFKHVNDSFGHAAGDEALVQVALRLTRTLRDTDTLGRVGADEFVVVLGSLRAPSDVEVICAKLKEAFAAPLLLAGRELVVTASIGVACAPTDGSDAATLLRNAGSALHRAKQSGGGQLAVFAPEMHAATVRRVMLESDLQQALSHPQLSLVYQPIVDCATGQIHAAEALIRWRHPALGEVLPSEFIRLAEETGLIDPIGDWAIHTTCAQARLWNEVHGRTPRLGVNISPRQLQRPNFSSFVAEAARAAGIDAGDLVLEITETAFVRDVDAVRGTLRELKEHGFLIAVDDFGIGYSSLEYLRHFPLDIVKIDRGFVAGSTSNPVDAAIVRSVTMLAKSLGLLVVAEGVEHPEQLELLSEIGCDLVQGYHLAKPLTPSEFASRVWPEPAPV